MGYVITIVSLVVLVLIVVGIFYSLRPFVRGIRNLQGDTIWRVFLIMCFWVIAYIWWYVLIGWGVLSTIAGYISIFGFKF